MFRVLGVYNFDFRFIILRYRHVPRSENLGGEHEGQRQKSEEGRALRAGQNRGGPPLPLPFGTCLRYIDSKDLVVVDNNSM